MAETRKEEFSDLVHNTQGTVGEHIWNYVKKELEDWAKKGMQE